MKPNLGRYDGPPDWEEILVSSMSFDWKRNVFTLVYAVKELRSDVLLKSPQIHFRGSDLQNYFTKILEDDIKATIKPQYVDHIPRAVRGLVGDILKKKDERTEKEGWDCFKWATEMGELTHVLDRDVGVLSGGELQRFAIAAVAVQASDVYMFDEPSSYLDVKQRLTAAHMIRQVLENVEHGSRRYVLVVEHDLAVLDYLSDYVCVLYGSPGAYGVVTMPFSVRVGINAFLAGFIPTENLRFRDDSLTFKISERAEAGGELGKNDVMSSYSYPSMTKTQTKGTAKFILHVEEGQFTDSEIIVLLGTCILVVLGLRFVYLSTFFLEIRRERNGQDDVCSHARGSSQIGRAGRPRGRG